jgi:hypothetical protein
MGRRKRRSARVAARAGIETSSHKGHCCEIEVDEEEREEEATLALLQTLCFQLDIQYDA